MYYRVNGTHGYVKLDWKTAWETIMSIVEAGYCDLHRSFKLSL